MPEHHNDRQWAIDEVERLQAENVALRAVITGLHNLADENGPDILTAIERREMKEILADLIRELPRSERLILSLYYYEGLKMSEIGNLLGITESRVSQFHARAVTLLRAHVRGMQELRE